VVFFRQALEIPISNPEKGPKSEENKPALHKAFYRPVSSLV